MRIAPNVVISILDLDGNTDNIVLVDVTKKKLTWIPRDLYVFHIRQRLGHAFGRDGSRGLLRALRSLGFDVKYNICISHGDVRKVLDSLTITVPVELAADYYYPVVAFEPIEKGKKIISFFPPYEVLSGERIHQFLGARFRVNKEDYVDFSDFERIKRQMVFVKQLLIERFDFSVFVKQEMLASEKEALKLISLVNAQYECHLYRNCRPVTVNKASVLISDRKAVFWMKLYTWELFFLSKRVIKSLFRTIASGIPHKTILK